MNKIYLKSIGIIHSPYNDLKEIPIQGKLNDKIEGYAELDEKYSDGLYDLDKFSHAILIYYFHKSNRTDIKAKPFLEKVLELRPNHKNAQKVLTFVDKILQTPS